MLYLLTNIQTQTWKHKRNMVYPRGSFLSVFLSGLLSGSLFSGNTSCDGINLNVKMEDRVANMCIFLPPSVHLHPRSLFGLFLENSCSFFSLFYHLQAGEQGITNKHETKVKVTRIVYATALLRVQKREKREK